MSRIAWLDCPTGVSGDMFLAALIDAGAPLPAIEEALSGLDLGSFRLASEETSRNGLRARSFRVISEEAQVSRYHYGIARLIESSSLEEPVKQRALAVFRALAEAESRVHGVPMEKVHFHEVGALDSIVDIVGSAVAVELLGLKRLECSPLPLGSGFVETAHGVLPVPVPAVIELVKDLPVRGTSLQAELVTPTGAALVKTLCSSFGPCPEMTVRSCGAGAGSRELELPNIMRVLIGEEPVDRAEGLRDEELIVMETNIDDMNPELLSYASEELLAAGALDVWLTPMTMKKGRSAVLLSVICGRQDVTEMAGLIFRETTSIGLRCTSCRRLSMERRMERIEIGDGSVSVKIAEYGGTLKAAPEYEDCAELARKAGRPAMEVYEEARSKAIEEFFSDDDDEPA